MVQLYNTVYFMMATLLVLTITWTFFGMIFYVFAFPNVKRPMQKIVLLTVAGPFWWVVLPSVWAWNLGMKNVFNPFYSWLTKH
jgi:hypothetical protein